MGPLRLMARIRSQKSGVVSTNGIGLSQPAQLTSTCTVPQRATTSPTTAATRPASATSTGQAWAASADLAGHGGGAVGVEVEHGHPRALGGHGQRDGAADAAGGRR